MSKQLDLKKFSILMGTLAEVFDPIREISKQRMEIYAFVLSDYEIEKISIAVKNLIKTRKYHGFPTPAEIIEAIEEIEENEKPVYYLAYKSETKRLTDLEREKGRQEARKILEMLSGKGIKINI